MNGTKSRRLDRLLTRPPKENGTESLHSICAFIYGIFIGGLCPLLTSDFGFRVVSWQTREMNINPSKQDTYGRSSLSELNRSGPEIEPEHSKRRRLTTLIRGRSHCKNKAIKVLCKLSKSNLSTSNITKLTNIMTYSMCLWVVKVTSLGNFTPDLGQDQALP